MTEPLRPWPRSVPRPTIVLRATCPAEGALRALADALTAEGFRFRSSTAPLHLEATRTSWWELLSAMLPQKGVVIADAAPTADGCELRVHHPSGSNDRGARSRAVRTLERAIGTLRAGGARVVVDEWESGLPQRR